MAAKVKIDWKWLDWNENYKWAKDIVPQLNANGLREQDLNRCVYVIRANGLFAIRYPNRISPTLYIGEGNFKSRIIQHKNWLKPLIILVGEFSFQIGLCIPRVKNSIYAYKDFEARLLMEFKEEYGCAPLMNRQMENGKQNYEYYPIKDIRSAIMIGKGVRYHWALEPMPSSPFYEYYMRTKD